MSPPLSPSLNKRAIQAEIKEQKQYHKVLDKEAKVDEAKVATAIKETTSMSKKESKAARHAPKSEKKVQQLKSIELKYEKRLNEAMAAYDKAVVERQKAQNKLEVRRSSYRFPFPLKPPFLINPFFGSRRTSSITRRSRPARMRR
jgi:hypothetical protein